MKASRDKDAGCEGTVLDVETAPAAELIASAGSGARNGFERPALHRLVCASALRFRQSAATGAFSSLSLATFCGGSEPEHAIVGGVDLCMPDPADAAAALVTWNGDHDLRVLRHRAVALWMTGLPNLRGWSGGGAAGRHRDLMMENGRGARSWWRLVDACAGLGFQLHPDETPVTTMIGAGRWDRVAERNRLDVIGTFLVHAAREAFLRGCPVPVASAWTAIGDLLTEGAWGVHERKIATHHLVGVARRRLDEHGSAAAGCDCAGAGSRAGSGA